MSKPSIMSILSDPVCQTLQLGSQTRQCSKPVSPRCCIAPSCRSAYLIRIQCLQYFCMERTNTTQVFPCILSSSV
ncbi:hypothetical protein E2C01_044992 [Portunus trituberculatus]|uniref:Uncharacterized protein n=1 Tax=Portunus trituberculatus TaxID=210409 RepID=A0A5B7FX25_PORTR|nr:hypothetical protein [Portunus trituberculatus]